MIRLAFLLLFIAYPLLELAVLIWVGQRIGVPATLAIVVGSAILGILTLKRQGLSIVTRARQSLARGEAPVMSVAEGALVFLAGALLILPGLIGDTVGIALLIAPLRRAFAAWSLGRFATAGATHVRVFTQRVRGTGPTRKERPARPERPGPVIEGEYTRIDDPDESGPQTGRR